MDLLFLLILLVLLGFGLTMLFSASYAYSFYWEGNSFYYITRQLIYAAVGLAAMAALSFVDYHLLKRFAFLIYLIAIALRILWWGPATAWPWRPRRMSVVAVMCRPCL